MSSPTCSSISALAKFSSGAWSSVAGERALEEVQGRAGRISELERDRDALLASYEALALEELDGLTPEEHHGFYRTLRMIVYIYPEGGVELTSEFLPFGPSGPDDSPRQQREWTGR